MLTIQLVLLDDSGLDGHTVVIPGRKGNAIAGHHVGLVDKILQDLVQGVAHVDISVGKGRAVVQDIQGLILGILLHFVVKIDGVPVFQHFRLTLGESRTHGKFGTGQVQCAGVVFCHFFSPTALIRFGSFTSFRRKNKNRLTAFVCHETEKLRGTTHFRRNAAHLTRAPIGETLLTLTRSYGYIYKPDRPSAHRLGRDPTEKVPTAPFHQPCALCKPSLFGVLRQRLS